MNMYEAKKCPNRLDRKTKSTFRYNYKENIYIYSHTHTHATYQGATSLLYLSIMYMCICQCSKKGNAWDYPVCFASSNTLQVYRQSADLHLQKSSEPPFLKAPAKASFILQKDRNDTRVLLHGTGGFHAKKRQEVTIILSKMQKLFILYSSRANQELM